MFTHLLTRLFASHFSHIQQCGVYHDTLLNCMIEQMQRRAVGNNVYENRLNNDNTSPTFLYGKPSQQSVKKNIFIFFPL